MLPTLHRVVRPAFPASPVYIGTVSHYAAEMLFDNRCLDLTPPRYQA